MSHCNGFMRDSIMWPTRLHVKLLISGWYLEADHLHMDMMIPVRLLTKRGRSASVDQRCAKSVVANPPFGRRGFNDIPENGLVTLLTDGHRHPLPKSVRTNAYAVKAPYREAFRTLAGFKMHS